MAKNKKINYLSMDPVEVWHLVRSGNLKTFPNHFLDKEISKILVRQLVLFELNMNREDILNLDQEFFSSYKLGNVRHFFDCKVYNIVSYCFPELEIMPWEMKKSPAGMWKDENMRNSFVKYVAKKENIDLTNVEDLKRFSAIMIQKYSSSKPLVYAGGLFELIKPVIPDNIKEWQIFKVPKWDKEKAITAVKWLIEDKLKWNHEQIYNNLSASVFYKYDLGGLLSKFCNNSPLKAISLAYPEYANLKNKPFFSKVH